MIPLRRPGLHVSPQQDEHRLPLLHDDYHDRRGHWRPLRQVCQIVVIMYVFFLLEHRERVVHLKIMVRLYPPRTRSQVVLIDKKSNA